VPVPGQTALPGTGYGGSMIGMKRTTVTLPDDLAAEVETESRRRGVAVSRIVREALEEKLGRHARGGQRFAFVGLVNQGGFPQSDEVDEFLAREWSADRVEHRGR